MGLENVNLLDVLNLEQIEVNLFRGPIAQARMNRVFGGHVIAQAMMAARSTVEGRLPHSLHCYFILPGDPAIPIVYEVERLRDGGSFTTRRVSAIQHGRAIFSTIVSFCPDEDGFDHQSTMPPNVPGPDDVDVAKFIADLKPILPVFAEFIATNGAIDIRPVTMDRYLSRTPTQGFSTWMRTRATLPDDRMTHLSALAYASDMLLLDAAMAPHGDSLFSGDYIAASLDHAVWFHRPFRADEWLLYCQDSPNASGGRGLTLGSFYRQDGTLVASVAQEGLLRRRRPQKTKPA